MATDFFERQAVARRNTKWLVAMFVFAVFAIVGTTFVVTAFAVAAANNRHHGRVPIEVPLLASAAALTLIVVGSLYKTAQLSAGGGTVVPFYVWIDKGGRVVEYRSVFPGTGVGVALVGLHSFGAKLHVAAPSPSQVVDLTSLTPSGERENSGGGDSDGG